MENHEIEGFLSNFPTVWQRVTGVEIEAEAKPAIEAERLQKSICMEEKAEQTYRRIAEMCQGKVQRKIIHLALHCTRTQRHLQQCYFLLVGDTYSFQIQTDWSKNMLSAIREQIATERSNKQTYLQYSAEAETAELRTLFADCASGCEKRMRDMQTVLRLALR